MNANGTVPRRRDGVQMSGPAAPRQTAALRQTAPAAQAAPAAPARPPVLRLSNFHMGWIGFVGLIAAANLVSTWVSFDLTRRQLDDIEASIKLV